MTNALMQLAVAAGIESGYWDGLGTRRDLSEATAMALLSALGFDIAADSDAHTRSLADEPFLATLPPAIVMRQSATPCVTVALPLSRRDETIAWEIALEGGERHNGSFVPAQLTLVDEREIDGQRHARFNLPLPDGISIGYHEFRLPSLACAAPLIIGPDRCFIPEPLKLGARCWGIALQLYALRSSRNWGIGDFGDLAGVVAAAGRAGASFVGLNPLHARHLVRPDEASPYAPSSRMFLDPLYIAVDAVVEFEDCTEARAEVASPDFQARIAAARQAGLVDYAAVTALKMRVFELLFERFRQRCAVSSDPHVIDFLEFKRCGGKSLARFVEFEALRLHFREIAGRAVEWREWPLEYRDPAGPATELFRVEAADRIEFQAYLQWVAARQLGDAAQAANAAGMPVGLYRDLAVGAAQDSAETWSEQYLFAPDVSVGAPPDMLNRQGQTWGLPPWKPRGLARQAYAPFRRMLAANMRDAGALRIDHVMAITRLFWIPAGTNGADGGYVRCQFDELAAIIALESVRNRCLVIGEDLGSVPDGLRARLNECGFLSYRVLIYERHWQGDGQFCRPHEYPNQSIATIATHDMPTVTEYWRGGDIARRMQLGMYPTQQQCDDETARRNGEREGILRLLGELGLSPGNPADAGDVIESLHAAIARTASMLVVVQLDDLVGEEEPVNIPGTYREYPNWRRKLRMPIEEIFNDARWYRLAAIMREAGRASPVSPA